MGIPIVRGRDFALSDATEAPGVVIINEMTAKKYWPDRDPIGQRLKIGRPESDAPWLTVVGVVGNVRHFGLDADVRRDIYRPYSQAAWPVMTVVAKTVSDPAAFASSIRAGLQGLDPDLPVSRVSTMEEVERLWLGPRRFPMILLAVFAAVALVLAVVGVYGVVSYVVAQRTREMGIRVALGARAPQLLALVIGSAMRPVVVGLLLGVAGGAAAGRLLSTLLYQVSPHDPGVLGPIAAVLAVAAVAASFIPARRATAVDPLLVLKAE
jgi:putative ABC transport system permease protein